MRNGELITSIKGIGPKKAEGLGRLGIFRLRDFLYNFPVKYQDRRNVIKISDLAEGEISLVLCTVNKKSTKTYHYGRNVILKLLASDETGGIEITFFNARYMTDLFKEGEKYFFYGKVTSGNGVFSMAFPESAPASDMSFTGIKPVYALTKGITQKEIKKYTKTAFDICEREEEFLPKELLEKYSFKDINEALQGIHFPESREMLLKSRERVIFNELLLLQLGISLAKNNLTLKEAVLLPDEINTDAYLKSLPFPLTKAQERVLSQITEDMRSGRVMNRLIQGDVGSGKTAVAECALYLMVKSGYQGAFMAPTEILARQQYDTLHKNFSEFGITVDCITGSMTAREKKTVLENLESGKTDVIVGTHALIQDNVKFNSLAIVITDEQHRFGVNQRKLLCSKGYNPHMLVMTATPIPRTLAMVVYGDLDISVIDELPPGRKEIKTKAVTSKKRDDVYRFTKELIDEGRQCYVVAPLIEATEEIKCRSVEELYDEMKVRFPGYCVDILHGGMKQSEKDEIMERFRGGKTDILVSTVVIEVGINVPNAAVMVIENSERFGLAQLHQLRGRIGRGKYQSYCFLINEGSSETSRMRGEIMQKSSDGFYIAEKDMELRGPGELFGTKQHGIPDLHMADLIKHVKSLDVAAGEAKKILEEDPALSSEKYSRLRNQVFRLFGEKVFLQM